VDNVYVVYAITHSLFGGKEEQIVYDRIAGWNINQVLNEQYGVKRIRTTAWNEHDRPLLSHATKWFKLGWNIGRIKFLIVEENLYNEIMSY
jgi:hypothetical protein